VIGNTFIASMVETLSEGHVVAEKSGLGTDQLHKFIEIMCESRCDVMYIPTKVWQYVLTASFPSPWTLHCVLDPDVIRRLLQTG
jgi:3-hydroxyisobutyrate dehydrogenase-like beta-hydroxyacid dehydrogenase